MMVVSALLLAACGVGEPDGAVDAESSSGPPDGAGEGSTTPTSPAPPTSAPETTPDPDLVAACVEYVQFQAYVGHPEGRAIWTRAGETADGLRAECHALAVADRDGVRAMRDELVTMHEQAEVAAEAEEAADASTTLAPGCHPDYGDCLPIVTDIDCVGDDDGDGPLYQAVSVIVFGDDEYELDGDEDGLACEPGDR